MTLVEEAEAKFERTLRVHVEEEIGDLGRLEWYLPICDAVEILKLQVRLRV